MSIPIIFEYDYKFKVQDISESEIFESLISSAIKGGIEDIVEKQNEVGEYSEIEFSSLLDIDWFLSKILETKKDELRMIYGTLNYADEYTGDVFRYRETNSCEYCRDLFPSKIPKGEILSCCDECLCACSEITHKGDLPSLEKMRVINQGGISFRVCVDCIPEFTKC